MRIVIYRHGSDPVAVDADRVRVTCGPDHLDMREHGSSGHAHGGLLVRLEEHDGALGTDLAVFPLGSNSVRLKGGLR